MGLIKRYSDTLSKTFNINVAPSSSSLVSVPAFGPSYPIYKSATTGIYCVGCGAHGAITLSGSISWWALHPKSSKPAP